MRGLVFGAWGEGSPEVDRLIGMLAHVGSRRQWRSVQARPADEAQEALAWMLRRRWAPTALRENARLNSSASNSKAREGLQQQQPES